MSASTITTRSSPSCAICLTADGVALVHTIGRTDGPGATNPWTPQIHFPRRLYAALREVTPAIERSGLYVTDVEILRLHYADTLAEWRARFRSNWARPRALR